MDFGIGFVDPSDIDNIELSSPIVNTDEAFVLTKWDLNRVFDFVERGIGCDGVSNTDEAMFGAFEHFVLKEMFEIVIIHLRGNDVGFG